MEDFLVARCTVGSKINSAKTDAYSVYQVFFFFAVRSLCVGAAASMGF